jgi:hypothetical protein
MARKRLGFAAAALASLAVAAPAQADPGTDFLTALTGKGFDVGVSSTDVTFTLAQGEHVCSLLHYNLSPDDARAVVGFAYPKATPEQVTYFVQAAHDHLCAQAYAPIEPE